MASNQDELWKSPAVRPLSEQQVRDMSESLGFDSSPEEVTAFTGHIEKMLKSYQRINEMTEPALPVKHPRTPGYRPSEEENSLNAWYYKCEIKGADTGKLAGKKLAIKDNTAVAGVPMMNGSKIMEGYVPEFDATVVTRILDAGGVILGKAACEDLCISGGGHNNSLGPVLNPVNNGHVTGGSSSGSAALVGAGEVDMATGGDQGGSIRIPSAWCGIVGLKPTYGLVPYTGCVPIEMTIDHCGPIARNVRDCALLLEVLAGYDDGKDPRQPRDITVPEYSQLLTENLQGKRIALIEEGFEGCEADVADMVRSAARKLELRGAVVESVSLPVHKDAYHVWTGVILEGLSQTMVRDNCHSPGWKGQYFTSMLDKLAQGYASRPRDNSEIVRMFVIAGEYLTTNYHGRFFAKAQNLARYVTREYNKLLEKYDVMIMPTLPYKAPKLPTTQSTTSERLDLGSGMLKNTAPFDVSGHPSLSINVGYSEGLPVGMQITGRHFDDLTVLQVAAVAEKIRDQE